jgi:hypothetical protein
MGKAVTKKIMILFLLAAVVIPSTSFAETYTIAAAKGLTPEEKTELTGTRKQLATIVFSGLAGAILGLSTLSFYGRPQDHLSSIAVGAALGVIGGAIYTTYKTATKPYESYDVAANESLTRISFEEESYKRMAAFNNSQYQPHFGWQWKF